MTKRTHIILTAMCLMMMIVAALLLRAPQPHTTQLARTNIQKTNFIIKNERDFTSPAGIAYGKDLSGRFDSRIAHIMAHTKPDASKPKHSQFLFTYREDVLRLLDEAWKKRGPPQRQGGTRGRDVYDIGMKQVIGTAGETTLRMVMERDTAIIITAYPISTPRRYAH